MEENKQEENQPKEEEKPKVEEENTKVEEEEKQKEEKKEEDQKKEEEEKKEEKPKKEEEEKKEPLLNKGNENNKLYPDQDEPLVGEAKVPELPSGDSRSETRLIMKSIRDDFSIPSDKERSSSFCESKPYIVEPEVYHVINSDEEVKGKVKSIVTILSVWNTMIGSSSVTMPKFVKEAGIVPCIFINAIFMLICFYTARVVVKTGGKDKDYSDTVSRYFGKKFGYIGRCCQILFNLSINVGATFIYFVIINQNFFPVIAFVLKKCGLNVDPEDISVELDHFSMIYCGMIISILVFPLLIMKDMSKLVKINSLGVYFVSTLLIFEIIMGIISLTNTTFKIDYIENKPGAKTRYLYLFGDQPSSLCGALSLGYFSHSFVLPVMASNANQKNNKRDLFLGYLCVLVTYIVVGLFGYIGFTGSNFNDAETFYDNWFRFFKSDNIFILCLRLLNVFQLLSIFPVLFFIVRIQFFGTFFGSAYPGKKHVICFSATLVVICWVVLFFCADKLGKLLSFVGAITGLFLIYIIPMVVNIVYYNRRHPANLEQLQREKNEGILDTTPKDIDDFGFTDKPMNKTKNFFFYVSQGLLICFGLFVMVIQFYPINFFGIELVPPKEN